MQECKDTKLQDAIEDIAAWANELGMEKTFRTLVAAAVHAEDEVRSLQPVGAGNVIVFSRTQYNA